STSPSSSPAPTSSPGWPTAAASSSTWNSAAATTCWPAAACCWSTATASRASTTSTAIWSATACCRAWPTSCARPRASTTSPAAWAATSSACWSAPSATATSCASPSSWSTPRTRCPSCSRRRRRSPPWASTPARCRRNRPGTTGTPMPTRPCIAPSASAATASNGRTTRWRRSRDYPMNAPDSGIGNDSGPQVRTLLLTDLCDSTTLGERLGGNEAAELFRAHDRLVLKLQQQWHGRLIDRSDGLLLLFERPIDGLGFAMDYVRGLRDLGEQHKVARHGVELQARAGLHVGEVLTWRNS